ncbi:MAG: hypothetical protein WC285_00005 [Candidatus Gracilibacteria bacterium]|jgi:hypothetical protein
MSEKDEATIGIFEGGWRQFLEEQVDQERAYPIDARQLMLTRKHLIPGMDDLFHELVEVRRSVDRVVKKKLRGKCERRKKRRDRNKSHTVISVHNYPIGLCFWIRDRVWEIINGQLHDPTMSGMRTLNRFVNEGGVFKRISGTQHRRYFQSGLQAGAYWLDVANDTVDADRPPVECTWLAQSGFEDIEDLEVCGDVIESYWDATVYPNTVFPYLAPIYPLIVVHDNGRIELLELSQGTVAGNVLSGFRDSKKFLFSGKFSDIDLPDEIRVLIGKKCSQTGNCTGGRFLENNVFRNGVSPDEWEEIFDNYIYNLEIDGVQFLRYAKLALRRFNEMSLMVKIS